MFGGSNSGIWFSGTFDYLNIENRKIYVESDAIGSTGRTDDWRQKYDIGFKADYKDLSFDFRYLNKKRGSYIGVINILNDETVVQESYMFADLRYNHEITDDLHINIKAFFDE